MDHRHNNEIFNSIILKTQPVSLIPSVKSGTLWYSTNSEFLILQNVFYAYDREKFFYNRNDCIPMLVSRL